MAIWQGKSMKTPSGGRAKMNRGKRKAKLGREPAETKIGETKARKIRTRGGNEKMRLATENKINVVNSETQKSEVADIIGVIENNANPNFVRRNIITKGAILETSAGTVKVTSRPGQDGVLNGVIVADE